MKIKILIISFLIKSFSYGQAGNLDLTFNNGLGYKFETTRNGARGYFYGRCALLQTDGNIIVGGYNRIELSNDVFAEDRPAVLRLNADGTKDLSFGINGIITLVIPPINNIAFNFGFKIDGVNYMTLQDDGKIILVGNNTPYYSTLNTIRLNPDGSLDNSFGVNGVSIITTGFDGCEANAVKVLTNGKILIAGLCGSNVTGSEARVIRLLSNGTIDTTFGINGYSPSINGTLAYQSTFRAISIQNDGKIVCSGEFNAINNTTLNFVTVRYNPDGSFDNSFGINGIAQNPTSSGYDIAINQLIQPDGKILTIGQGEGITLVRLNIDGSLDSTFNPNGIEPGILNNSFNGFNSLTGWSMVLQPDAKIVLVGTFIDTIIARLNPDGSLDTSFNNVGYTISNYGQPENVGDDYHSVFLLPTGKILVVGQTPYVDGMFTFAYTTVTRYNSGLNLSNESFNKNNVTVYPNPTNNKSFFDNSQSQFNNLEIYNYLGQLVSSQKMQFSNNQEIDLSKFSTGIYVLKMSN